MGRRKRPFGCHITLVSFQRQKDMKQVADPKGGKVEFYPEREAKRWHLIQAEQPLNRTMSSFSFLINTDDAVFVGIAPVMDSKTLSKNLYPEHVPGMYALVQHTSGGQGQKESWRVIRYGEETMEKKEVTTRIERLTRGTMMSCFLNSRLGMLSIKADNKVVCVLQSSELAKGTWHITAGAYLYRVDDAAAKRGITFIMDCSKVLSLKTPTPLQIKKAKLQETDGKGAEIKASPLRDHAYDLFKEAIVRVQGKPEDQSREEPSPDLQQFAVNLQHAEVGWTQHEAPTGNGELPIKLPLLQIRKKIGLVWPDDDDFPHTYGTAAVIGNDEEKFFIISNFHVLVQLKKKTEEGKVTYTPEPKLKLRFSCGRHGDTKPESLWTAKVGKSIFIDEKLCDEQTNWAFIKEQIEGSKVTPYPIETLDYCVAPLIIEQKDKDSQQATGFDKLTSFPIDKDDDLKQQTLPGYPVIPTDSQHENRSLVPKGHYQFQSQGDYERLPQMLQWSQQQCSQSHWGADANLLALTNSITTYSGMSGAPLKIGSDIGGVHIGGYNSGSEQYNIALLYDESIITKITNWMNSKD